MGDVLVVMTVPEEVLWLSKLYERGPDGREILVEDSYRDAEGNIRMPSIHQVWRDHPDAYYRLAVSPREDAWMLPAHPGWESGAVKSWQDLDMSTYGDFAADSLMSFLNGKLERLDRMMRTVRWLLGSFRVCSVEWKEAE